MGTAFWNMLLKERYGEGSRSDGEDEEEDISSYWMILKREDTGNWKIIHWITLCRELAFEEAMEHEEMNGFVYFYLPF